MSAARARAVPTPLIENDRVIVTEVQIQRSG
jgi:hypothetical protein